MVRRYSSKKTRSPKVALPKWWQWQRRLMESGCPQPSLSAVLLLCPCWCWSGLGREVSGGSTFVVTAAYHRPCQCWFRRRSRVVVLLCLPRWCMHGGLSRRPRAPATLKEAHPFCARCREIDCCGAVGKLQGRVGTRCHSRRSSSCSRRVAPCPKFATICREGVLCVRSSQDEQALRPAMERQRSPFLQRAVTVFESNDACLCSRVTKRDHCCHCLRQRWDCWVSYRSCQARTLARGGSVARSVRRRRLLQ